MSKRTVRVTGGGASPHTARDCRRRRPRPNVRRRREGRHRYRRRRLPIRRRSSARREDRRRRRELSCRRFGVRDHALYRLRRARPDLRRRRHQFAPTSAASVGAWLLPASGREDRRGRPGGTRPGGNFDFVLARYNADGSLDASFDGDGRVFTDFGFSDVAYGVAIQPDGKIVAVGNARSGSSRDTNEFGVARYNPDGSLDASFDGDGKVLTAFTPLTDAPWTSLSSPTGRSSSGATRAFRSAAAQPPLRARALQRGRKPGCRLRRRRQGCDHPARTPRMWLCKLTARSCSRATGSALQP